MQFILQVLHTYTVICIHYFKFAEIDQFTFHKE